uniref:hypothetical protein n=1 Tax=Clostridium sp. 12(A) TaxID=1163671 RepID=UPI0004643B46|nr:hypothetical protein [Clostridium sp. 12(A)]
MFEEALNDFPTDNAISIELAILRKGYYNPHSWGFAEEERLIPVAMAVKGFYCELKKGVYACN